MTSSSDELEIFTSEPSGLSPSLSRDRNYIVIAQDVFFIPFLVFIYFVFVEDYIS